MPYQKGQTATGPNGETIVFDGENWIDQEPSAIGETVKDVARGGLAGLEHGGAQLLGLPGSTADLAAYGIGKAADWWQGGENPVSSAMTKFRGALADSPIPLTAS